MLRPSYFSSNLQLGKLLLDFKALISHQLNPFILSSHPQSLQLLGYVISRQFPTPEPANCPAPLPTNPSTSSHPHAQEPPDSLFPNCSTESHIHHPNPFRNRNLHPDQPQASLPCPLQPLFPYQHHQLIHCQSHRALLSSNS
jgi:hypothetical protein